MNNTNTTQTNGSGTFINPWEYYYALFVSPTIVVRLYQIAYPISFLLGFIGNTTSLLTFSRATLRRVSTGCLFIILAISDTLFLIMCVFDFVEFGLQVRFYGHVDYDQFCRFRLFVMSVSQVLSSWILTTISVDRWIRTRFPFKSGYLCTPKKALIVVGILLLIIAGLHGHMLSPLFRMLIPGFANGACGADVFNAPYLDFYLYRWSVLQIVIICLVPAILMLLVLMDIFISVRVRKQAFTQPVQIQIGNNRGNQQKNLQLQMFILMLTSVCIFLVTTLPLGIYKITSARQPDFLQSILRVTSIYTGLGWFQSLNYAVNFYIHCLTSTLFRREFKQQMAVICCVNQTRVEPANMTQTGHRTELARK